MWPSYLYIGISYTWINDLNIQMGSMWWNSTHLLPASDVCNMENDCSMDSLWLSAMQYGWTPGYWSLHMAHKGDINITYHWGQRHQPYKCHIEIVKAIIVHTQLYIIWVWQIPWCFIHTEAETKLLPFHRWHCQMYFLEWKCINFN